MCYQALTSKVPDEAMDRIRKDPLIPITEAVRGKATEPFLSAIDWSLRVEEADRPQGVRVWRSALLGEEKVPAPVSKDSATQIQQRPEQDKTQKTITRWLLATGILLLIGASVWWGIQEYPELFGQGSAYIPAVTEQEPLAETPQETETQQTEAAVASAEETTPSGKAEAEQPASKEPAQTPEEAEVARLLTAAEADLKARRLTSPAGNNAWDRYQQVLGIDPANPDAIRGMERVIESYMELFGSAVKQEDFDKATGYLAKIRELHPDSPVLEEGERSLAAAKQTRVDRLAEEERQRQAEEAARQAELEQQRIAKAIEEHWTAFEAAMQAQDLNEAAGILVQIRDLKPEEPGLAAGEQRLADLERQLIVQIVQEHWVAFEAALEAEDLDEAADILAQVRDLKPEAQGLAGNEQRLAEARQTAIEREYAGEMVSISGGTFRMGDMSGEGEDDELPVHTVTVPAFRMGRYEVTFAQWDACVADGGCGGYRPDDEGWGRGNRPVINVSWDDTQSFIDWLNDKTGGKFRLPTEAEWEYAARAGSTTKYHFGDSESQLCRYANHADTNTDYSNRNKSCSDGVGKRTAAVGRYQPNAFGLHDMHGNVWEWVQDCWNDNYVGAPNDGRAWTSGDCGQRTLRCGSWYNGPRALHLTTRTMRIQSSNYSHIGFRLAQDK